MSDERGYQVLDYVEFLESKFAERGNPAGNAFTRFTEAVEDHLRAGRVSASVIVETMGLLNKASNVLAGAMAAGKSVATDLVSAATTPTSPRPPTPGGPPPGTAAQPPPSGGAAGKGEPPAGA